MTSTPKPPPPTLRLAIDTGALAANWRALDALSGSARAGAAVKADCYGLGIDNCLPALVEAGARDFFVAHWSEVAPLLAHVAPEQISVLHGPMTAAEAQYAIATGVRPVINSLHQARLWHEAGGGACHLMVDTGINRLGITPGELSDPLLKHLDVHVLMSHLSSAEETTPANGHQLAAFRAAQALIPHRETSIANSAGIALGRDYHWDLTRPGLALYGGVPSPALADHIRQVAFPQAAVIHTRKLEAGDTVGYNREFTASAPMRVGTVSLGYADGFLRSWGGEGFLVHEGRKLPLRGKVSMDMVVVDLADAPEVGIGDWLDVPYHLPDAAARCGLSQYELLTVLGHRFARSVKGE
ncbi:alanine racemase [Alteriqipengyuania lutimaris]|uniref:Alanine racemase n=1 Tax=Alteriqipengyuania lutimaris TaxID=1538146 RepID=A0A395LU83_9SPHN|nr:alanine racemase [Alteriqipengyuania lutimaris]MBB3032881.1 alanine racemase [Alteriqipengyuania lutimaris]RDS78030.1 alanine racemase [Alteriqipengyuania lutimaris]